MADNTPIIDKADPSVHNQNSAIDKEALYRYVDMVANQEIPESPEQALLALKDYECWESYAELVDLLAAKLEGKEKVKCYQLSTEAWAKYAYSPVKAAEIMVRVLEELDMAYEDFFHELLLPSKEHENYEIESQILEYIANHYKNDQFLEPLLERLTMIYDKKLHLDDKHEISQQRLLELNPENLKSLKFFKNRYQQMGDWKQVADVLRKMLKCSSHKVEQARFAMELASVNIFQLGDPESCISTLDDFVGDSLDSKKIKLLALMELRRFSKCLSLISEMLSSAKDDNELSIIYYHKGVAESQSGNYRDGFSSFCKSYELKNHPATLVYMVRNAIQMEDVEEIRQLLPLIELCSDPSVKESVRD